MTGLQLKTNGGKNDEQDRCCLLYTSRGDILYVSSLDRLSRSKADIKSELIWFKEKGISLRVLDLPTTMIEYPADQEWIRDMTNNILIEVLASMAEIERVRIRQRQREGIDAAKRRGKHLGRPEKGFPENWDYYYTQYRKGVFTRRHVMDELEITEEMCIRDSCMG